MKIRYIWEVSDIKAGMFISRQNYSKESPCGQASMTYMIGYRCDIRNDGTEGAPAKYTKVSITDGMIGNPRTKEQLAQMFNEDEYGFEPTNKEDVINMIDKIKNG